MLIDTINMPPRAEQGVSTCKGVVIGCLVLLFGCELSIFSHVICRADLQVKPQPLKCKIGINSTTINIASQCLYFRVYTDRNGFDFVTDTELMYDLDQHAALLQLELLII